MWISAKIRRHILNLQDGQPFPTRDLLAYGSRGAVDKSIQRLVKAELIMRVARGIFVKPLYERGVLKLPTAAQIALTKAHAFGKKLIMHGKDAACRLGILESGNEEPTFVASGSSSSFLCKSSDFGDTRVHFRSASALASKFEDTSIGLIFRGMRSLPSDMRDPTLLERAIQYSAFGRVQLNEFKGEAKWMPAWLSKWVWAWIKPAPSSNTKNEAPSWDFLKRRMTEKEFADFAAREIKPWIPPWIEFPPAPEPNWALLRSKRSARSPTN
jgi:hypothetical protein